MRLLLTADTVGGVWQYAVELADALAAHDVETVLAVLGPPPSAEQRAQAAALANATLVETGLPLDWLCDGPGPVLAAGAAISALALRHGVDLIHYNMPTLAAAALPPLPTVAVTHGCVATWWNAARRGPLDPGFRWHRKLTAEGLHAVDRVVSPTAAYARTIARHYSIQRPAVVHNGRRATPLPDVDPVDEALTVGRLWDMVKGADILDGAAKRLSVPFRAAGATEGPHGERAVLSYLDPIGHVDERALRARLAARPVFVSAASFEPFGLAVLEAASAGCALVLSDIPTFRELWDQAAVFVRHDDAGAYAAAIEALIADPARRRQLGAAAQARAVRYTPAATANGMLAIYRQAAAAGAPRRRVAA